MNLNCLSSKTLNHIESLAWLLADELQVWPSSLRPSGIFQVSWGWIRIFKRSHILVGISTDDPRSILVVCASVLSLVVENHVILNWCNLVPDIMSFSLIFASHIGAVASVCRLALIYDNAGTQSCFLHEAVHGSTSTDAFEGRWLDGLDQTKSNKK